MIKYFSAPDIDKKVKDVAGIKEFSHLDTERITCFRSKGSKSRRIIARCHSLSKLMQLSLNVEGHYALEFVSEKFDKLDEEEKIKTIIHELMHIPKNMGGGFRHHKDHVTERNVEIFYKSFMDLQNNHSLRLFP